MPHTTPHKPESHAHLRKYPWHKLANGKPVTIKASEIDVPLTTVRNMAYKAARYRYLQAQTEIIGDQITIRFVASCCTKWNKEYGFRFCPNCGRNLRSRKRVTA